MIIAGLVVKGYADGAYSLESAHGRPIVQEFAESHRLGFGQNPPNYQRLQANASTTTANDQQVRQTGS